MGGMKGGVRKTWREEIAHNCLRHSLSLETDSAPNVPINIQCAREAGGKNQDVQLKKKKTAVILFPCQGPVTPSGGMSGSKASPARGGITVVSSAS